MKIMTVLGTRPELIRLSLIIKKLDRYADRHVFVHTGQNFTRSLSGVFFEQLQIRKPDYVLSHKQQSLGEQLSLMFVELEKIVVQEKPDKVLLLGDTNSALSALLFERMGIPVIHMEAGNRCFDLNVPEEKNRKVIDAISSINMPYTVQSKENLLREGFPKNRILVTGNPIYEVLQHYKYQIDSSKILEDLNLQKRKYFLITIHRAENVDDPEHLKVILNSFNLLAGAFGVRLIVSAHPRTQSRMNQSIYPAMHPLVEFHEPFSFFDFVQLEKHAQCVFTDSGTVQEECCIFRVPTVTIRNSTERPETVDCGSNVVTGIHTQRIVSAARLMIDEPMDWICPEGYLATDVSSIVVKNLLGGM